MMPREIHREPPDGQADRENDNNDNQVIVPKINCQEKIVCFIFLIKLY